MEIRTYFAACKEDDEYLISQLSAEYFFDIRDDYELHKCRSSLSSDNSIYTSGYIEIEYFGQLFMGKRYWDYVIWFWFHIGEGIRGFISDNRDSEISFPDQQLYLCITPQGGQVLLELKEVHKSHQRAVFPREEFAQALVDAGIDVFSRLSKYNNSGKVKEMWTLFEWYKEVLGKARASK